MSSKYTYEGRDAEFTRLSKLHREYLGQITINTKPEKVKARVGELKEFVKKVDRLMFMLSWRWDTHWDSSNKYKTCAEMIAHWKTIVKIVTGVNL